METNNVADTDGLIVTVEQPGRTVDVRDDSLCVRDDIGSARELVPAGMADVRLRLCPSSDIFYPGVKGQTEETPQVVDVEPLACKFYRPAGAAHCAPNLLKSTSGPVADGSSGWI